MLRPAPLSLLVAVQTVVSAASLVVEIVAGRMLAPYVGMSLYTWTSVIAVVLAGFSAGHWWGGLLANRTAANALHATGWALIWAALTTGAAGLALPLVAEPVLDATGHPVWGIAALTLAVFFLPSLFAGVPAPVLAQVAVTDRDKSGSALGAMFAAGALGAIAGTLLAGFVFISWLGSVTTLAVVTGIYLVSALTCFVMAGARPWLAIAAGLLSLGMAGAALARPDPCTVESRYFCLRSVDVSADPDSPAQLMVLDHLVHGISTRDAPRVQFTDHAAMLDGLARLRAPRPEFTSFFIGGGTYSVPRAFTDHGTGAITVAEIDPEVTAMAARDFWFDPATATVLNEDARRALRDRPAARYDLILGDAFTDIAVPPHLVTREFFELVRDRLTPDGTYLMTVIDFEDRRAALGSIVTTLQQVFPVVEVWTRAQQPDPGARMVFVVAAGSSPSPQGQVQLNAPDPAVFAALDDRFITAMAQTKGMILTDDLAPMDRLIGRPD